MRPSLPDAGRAPRLTDRASARAALALAAASLVVGPPALARESDFTQPIDVSADRSEYDQRAGTQTLIGNVEIRQGTILITAERVTIALQDAKLANIEGSGSPIRFEQENEAGETVRGESSEISYDAIENLLVLSGGATLAQPGQRLSSERIAFDARSQTVSAEGGPGTGSAGKKGRVSIRLDAPPSDRNR